jgi:hypothetical protein
LPKDFHIDQGGNINQKSRLKRNLIIAGAIAGSVIAMNPGLVGLAGAGGGAAGGAAGAATGAGAGGSGIAGTAAGIGVTGGVAAGLPGAGTAIGAGSAMAGAAMPATTASMMGTAGKFLSGGKGAKGYLDTAGAVGDLLSSYAGGRAAGRVDEANMNSARDRALQDQYRTQIQANANENDFGLGRYRADLDTSTAKNNFGINRGQLGLGISQEERAQKQFSLDAPGQRAGNAVRGDILANAQDVNIDAGPNIPVPSISGGLRPSMFSTATRMLGGEMSKQALASQQAGDSFRPLPELPNYEAPSGGLPTYIKPPDAPGVSGLPQAGMFDRILSTAGAIGSIGGALHSASDYRNGRNMPRVVWDEASGRYIQVGGRS